MESNEPPAPGRAPFGQPHGSVARDGPRSAEASDGATVQLSLAMIVRDEAEAIAECLEAAREHVDEIVVLDTGSTDETAAVARRMGAEVLSGEWCDDFAAARNAVRERCRGRWILSLDADERIDPVNAHRLRRAIRYCDCSPEGQDVLALAITIESPVGPQGAGMTARHVFPRVFRNDPGVRWAGALHEQLVHAERNIMDHTRLTDVTIHHLGYEGSDAHGGRRERNARILAEEVRGATRFDRLSAAHTAISFGRHVEALGILRGLIDTELPPNLDATARWSFATSLAAIGRRESARHELEAAILRHPSHQSFRYMLGVIDLEDGRHLLARARFDELLAFATPAPSERTDVVPSRSMLRVQRARTFLVAGDAREALRQIDGVLAREPGHSEGCFQRAMCLDALGRHADCVTVLESLAEKLPGEAIVTEHLRRCRLRLAEAGTPPGRSITGIGEGPIRPVPARESGPVPGLTVAIIARDEASNLRQLLPALDGRCEAVVVVDTGSSDETKAVARAHGASVVTHAWNDDFSDARNRGLEVVSTPWVFWLDADERLPEASWSSIRALVTSGEADAASVHIENVHRGEDPVSASRGVYCRVFRADLGARFAGRVHEQILPSLEEQGARLVRSDIVVQHHGYALDAEAMERKKLRNMALLEKQAEEYPQDYYVWFQLGTTAVALGDHAGALEHFGRSRELMADATSEEIRLWTDLRVAQSSFVLGRIDDAERHARRALAREPELELANYLLAAVWSRRGRPLRSLACLRRILSRRTPDEIAPMRRSVVEADARRLGDAIERLRAAA